jgi:hypothetical protein
METVSSNALFYLTHRSNVKNPREATCDISISDLIDDQTGTAHADMQQTNPFKLQQLNTALEIWEYESKPTKKEEHCSSFHHTAPKQRWEGGRKVEQSELVRIQQAPVAMLNEWNRNKRSEHYYFYSTCLQNMSVPSASHSLLLPDTLLRRS